jgi:hypothetical protein
MVTTVNEKNVRDLIVSFLMPIIFDINKAIPATMKNKTSPNASSAIDLAVCDTTRVNITFGGAVPCH